MTVQHAGCVGIVVLVASLWANGAFAASDREKLLTDPGVYGTFAAYSFNDDWGRKEGATRIALLTVLKGVVEQHREKIAIDMYLEDLDDPSNSFETNFFSLLPGGRQSVYSKRPVKRLGIRCFHHSWVLVEYG